MRRPAERREFGIHGTEVGPGPAVVFVPPSALLEFRAELFDGSLAVGDLGFGLVDGVGEGLDLVEGRSLLLAALATEP